MNIREERLKELKQKTDPVDAKGMIESLLRARNLPQHERDKIIMDMEKAFEDAGNLSLLRAFEEDILTEKEWISMRDKYNFDKA